MPTTDRNGLSMPVRFVPGQEESGRPRPEPCSLSLRPPYPPTFLSPTMVSGSSAATMMKNCSTSL